MSETGKHYKSFYHDNHQFLDPNAFNFSFFSIGTPWKERLQFPPNTVTFIAGMK